MLLAYRTALVLAGVTATTVTVFFLWGIADGTIGRSNMMIWLTLVAMTIIMLVFAFRLRRMGQMLAATFLLMVLALPGLLVLLILGYTFIAAPR